ncbi:MAG: pseudouridine synthase [Burkholderiales bacterium]
MRLSRLILFNKPYGVVCQFGRTASGPTLKDDIPVPDAHPAGRLDVNSEGLVAFTDDGGFSEPYNRVNGALPTSERWL